MTKKDDKPRGRKKGPALSDADKALWTQFTRDIDPLHSPEADDTILETPAPSPRAPRVKKTPPISAPFVPPASQSSVTSPDKQAVQIDRRTAERLRRGKMDIEARIDLHGYTQERAHDALLRFIDQSVRRELRCVLVITGKGRSSHDDGEWKFNDGVLRQRVPQWLSSSAYADHVLKCVLAQPRDGGEGAYYVYLRRTRD